MPTASPFHQPTPWLSKDTLTDKRIPGIIRIYLAFLDSFPTDSCDVPAGTGCKDCGRVAYYPSGPHDQEILYDTAPALDWLSDDDNLAMRGAIINIPAWTTCCPCLCGWCVVRRLLAGNLKCPCGCGEYWRLYKEDYYGTETQCVCHPDMDWAACAACLHKRKFVDRDFCCPYCTIELDPNAVEGVDLLHIPYTVEDASSDNMDEDVSPVARLSKRDRIE